MRARRLPGRRRGAPVALYGCAPVRRAGQWHNKVKYARVVFRQDFDFPTSGQSFMSDKTSQMRTSEGIQTALFRRSPPWHPNTGSKPQQRHIRVGALDTLPFDVITHPLLLCGDAMQTLKRLPEQSIQTVVTSPPYWSLRDYGVAEQIGRDDSLKSYITSIVCTFDQIRRVLRDDGTVWLNVGDSYTSGNRRYRAPDRKNRARAMKVRPPTPEGLKQKDLIGVPWRLAFALQDAGWWVRSEVIWHKPNAHPESVRDRPTKAHETIFLLSKDKDYYYDHDIIKGPRDRRLRTVWEIPTEPVKRVNGKTDDHPAMMPLSLARNCVAITSRADSIVLDPYAGSGTTLLAAQELGRRWVGIEIKPAFVDLIERRLCVS